tara:strand:+ start:1469 stop:1843 length:375 start_codon:yes stop_codon:yes gene_type:complete
MKTILLSILFFIISTNLIAFEKKTNFTIEEFEKAQNEGKTVVVNSWNKFCSTCKAQTKVFESAQNDFKEVLFFFYEQTEHPKISTYLKIDYWTTIVVFKNNKEIAREMGLTKKDKIYDLIKKGI